MTQLTETRQRLKSAQQRLMERQADRGTIEQRWLSASLWHRNGYQIGRSDRSIQRTYSTPRGDVVTYAAYHAADVCIKPTIWARCLKATGRSGLNDADPNARRTVCHYLTGVDDALADRLSHSLTSELDYVGDRAKLDWLLAKIAQATERLEAVQEEYDLLWEPIVEKRRKRKAETEAKLAQEEAERRREQEERRRRNLFEQAAATGQRQRLGTVRSYAKRISNRKSVRVEVVEYALPDRSTTTEEEWAKQSHYH